VKRIKIAVTLLLLALWVPLTSHSLLEQWEWIHHEHTDSHSESVDHHDAADGLCRIESNASPLVPIDFQTASLTALFEPVFACFPEIDASAFPTGLAPPGADPPGLNHVWQFVFRAALPPRAPSFLS
jgi:hypothetical protein